MESTSYCTVGELRCLVEKGAWPQREMLLVLAQTAGEFDVLTEFDELMSGFRAALQIDRLRAVDRACWRRFKIEPPCRLNFEPGLMANL